MTILPVNYFLSSQTTIGKPHWGRTHKADFHNWHGVGGIILRDNIGAFKNTVIKVNYSYNIGITEGRDYGYEHKDGLRLALGVFAGRTSFRIDKDILGMSKVSDNSRIGNNSIAKDKVYQNLANNGTSAIDMTVGGVLYYAETYFLGFSSSQLFQSKVNSIINGKLSRHYFLSGMVKSRLNEDWYLIPSVLLKGVKGAPLSYEVTLRADWSDQLYAGLGYRYQDAVTFLVGARLKWGEKVKNFRRDKHRYIMQVYYSYDLTTSKLANKELVDRSKGSHEFTVGFLLPPMYKERNAEDTWRKKNTNNLHKKTLRPTKH